MKNFRTSGKRLGLMFEESVGMNLPDVALARCNRKDQLGGAVPRLIVMRMFAGAVALGLLISCGGGGSGTAPLTITKASPPAGTTGTVFPSYSFQATGGTPSFVWNESGPLPPGLTLSASGYLSGTPATAGTIPSRSR